ncbi:MAG: NAD(P)/FAD-dependent oxidoreductase [Flavobacteriales bacterium]|nr:NAD(P)/FAD-dependent oxidoreductase [Flavobacteriales bacterium]
MANTLAGEHYQIVVVGGGAGGIAVAASLLKRDRSLHIALIEPSEKHYYQAAFTLVGANAFDADETIRKEVDVLPSGVRWLKSAVIKLEPKNNTVLLDSGKSISYDYMVVCPGLVLDWQGIEGLEDTIGKNGVCSNYLLHYAEYTRECLASINAGRVLFTQPPMPIKCAGAPQKIMYLAAHNWEKHKSLHDFDIEFHTATPTLFGVAEFVPPLNKYIDRYDIELNLQSNLVAIDGPAKKAFFQQGENKVEVDFDVIHVVPPQRAPEFISSSPCADNSGWLAVDKYTLRSDKYTNVFGLGDVTNTPNAKTAAAVRKQVPVVCENLLASVRGEELDIM